MIQMLLSCHADADLGPYNNVKDAYMKQKHRMLWERRHGKVGTGMKIEEWAPLKRKDNKKKAFYSMDRTVSL